MRDPHDVFNQALPLSDHNLADGDAAFRDTLHANGAGAAFEALRTYGARLGTAEVLQWGEQANRHAPELHTYDRFGRRRDEVEFHPSYHALMKLATDVGLHAMPWEPNAPAAAHVTRAAHMYLRHQVDQGTSCPITMTYAVVPSLRLQPELAERWVPRVLPRAYDPRLAPASEKAGCLFGMAMTERQGGSDVRANTTTATPDGPAGPGGRYRLNGHKWFCSAPMCDAFLVLAQAPGGLSCFLVPRFLEDGTRNTLAFQRLKSKLGNRSNASSEVIYENTAGWMVGEEGRGVATIIEMVRHTRLDCAVGAASLMRRCVAEAIHHAQHRATFGKRLVDHALMQNVLADLCLESEAATALAFRMARAFDEADGDEQAAAFGRLATPVGKYWATKRESTVAREALECLGGNGYVEEGPMPRLFRESPLNAVWEGAGNVQCLDVLRAMQREPRCVEAFAIELDRARGADRRFDAYADRALAALREVDTLEVRARRVVEQLGLALQAALLLQAGNEAVSDAFIGSRIAGDWGAMLGTLGAGVAYSEIIARSTPVPAATSLA